VTDSGATTSRMQLAGKVALVTGASKGIGRALAVGLAAAGADVAVGYHTDRAGAEAVARDVEGLGRRSLVHGGDVASVDAVRRLVADVVGRFGRIDVLVNNAAIAGWAPALEMDEDLWDRVMATNLRGSFFCAIEAARSMASVGGGAIVNISSNIAALGVSNLSCYAASKAGLHAVTTHLAVEFAPLGIRVNALAPGPTVVDRNLSDDPDYEATWGSVVPLGRTARPEEMVGATVFLASEDSSYITGQVLYADGGWSSAGRAPAAHLDAVAARHRHERRSGTADGT
jgi:NAD(P)-dependent dehydrogenase (short-subunit alcohol dehydrogenase family)